MIISLDPDVERVAEFMLAQIPAYKLVGIASSLNKLAPLLWGQYESEQVAPLTLTNSVTWDHDPHTQLTANG